MRYRATIEIGAKKRRTFKTAAGAERYLAKFKAAFDEANRLCDGEIWENIELIYLTRWDCPTVRLAAAEGAI